jgi:GT2 family glycosyltransferase
MFCSVLIPTIGRGDVLIATVRALLEQTRVPDEIVVVDQNDPPIEAVDAFLAAVPPAVTSIRHLRSSKKGVTANVNVAWREAKGQIVIFLDDDVVPDKHLIERHLRQYDDPTVIGVAGRVEQPMGDRPPEQVRAVGRFYPWSGRIAANFNALRSQDVQIAPGGNMSFRRQAVEQVGGVDEAFDGNGYFWETDLCLRILQAAPAGTRLVFEPAASLKHLMAPSGGCRMPDKAMHTHYFLKNGMRLCRRHCHPLAVPIFGARMKFYLLAKAAYNLSPRILWHGWRGLLKGWLSG